MATKQVSHYLLCYHDNCISIKKKQSLLVKNISFYLVLLLLGALLFWSLLKESPNAFKKPINFEGVVFLSCVGVIVVINLVFGVIRFLRVNRNFSLCKRNTLTINNKPLKYDNPLQDISIAIQDVSGWGGIGTSFTVGIAQGKRFFGLCYELQKEQAKAIAEFIADNLEYRIEHRKAVVFPLFRLH